jgi:hypothetical protein
MTFFAIGKYAMLSVEILLLSLCNTYSRKHREYILSNTYLSLNERKCRGFIWFK